MPGGMKIKGPGGYKINLGEVIYYGKANHDRGRFAGS